MNREEEMDYCILRGCLIVWNVAPDDDVCPDVERIATSRGGIDEKIDRLGVEIEAEVRARRKAA